MLEKNHLKPGKEIFESDTTDTTLAAVETSSEYLRGGQEFQEQRHLQIAWMNMLVLPIFIGGSSLYTISFILQFISIIIVSCVLITKERRYKNIAHVSWCTAAVTLVFGIIFTFFFTITAVIARDSCIILDYTETKKTTAELPLIYPESLSPLLDSCLFSEEQNAADNLNFGTAA